MLGAELADVLALDVALVSQRDEGLVVGDEVFGLEVLSIRDHDLGPALVATLVFVRVSNTSMAS